MKKRAMKKWIPYNPCYCYTTNKYGKTYVCKWLKKVKNKDHQENGYCAYLKEGDWEDKGTSLLWDKCKECGVKDSL